jgi:hypothetical protein
MPGQPEFDEVAYRQFERDSYSRVAERYAGIAACFARPGT